MVMKSIVMILLIMSGSTAVAQYSRAFTLKTNITSPIHIGLEVPFGKAMAIDAGVSSFELPFITSIGSRTDVRLNLRYYFRPESKSAFFISLGLHSRQQYMNNFPKQDNSVETGTLDILNLAVGPGIRTRYFSFWLTLEPTIMNNGNRYVYKNTYGMPVRDEVWKPITFIGGGISWHFMNYIPQKYRQ
jgi:hypothetical protein